MYTLFMFCHTHKFNGLRACIMIKNEIPSYLSLPSLIFKKPIFLKYNFCKLLLQCNEVNRFIFKTNLVYLI